MAIAFDASLNKENWGSVTSGSVSFTVGAGSNRIIIVQFDFDTGGGADHVLTASYNGVALTVKGTATSGGGRNGEVWYLVAPASGSNTFAFTATVPDGANICTNIVSYSGVDQVTPLGTFQSNPLGGADTNPLITVTGSAGQTFVEFSSLNGAVGAMTVHSGSTQTQRVGAISPAAGKIFGSDAPGASSVLIEWDCSVNLTWMELAVPMNVAGAGPSPFPTELLNNQPNQLNTLIRL